MLTSISIYKAEVRTYCSTCMYIIMYTLTSHTHWTTSIMEHVCMSIIALLMSSQSGNTFIIDNVKLYKQLVRVPKMPDCCTKF